MKENKALSLRGMTLAELEEKRGQLREEMFKLRFRNAVKQEDNPLRMREVRRDIARIETVLNEHRKGIRSVAAHPSA